MRLTLCCSIKMVIETQIHHSEHFEDWMNAGAAAIGAQSVSKLPLSLSHSSSSL